MLHISAVAEFAGWLLVFSARKGRGLYWSAERLLDSQDGRCSVDLA